MSRRFPTFFAGVVFGLSLSAGVAVAGSPFEMAFRSLRAAADDNAQIQAIAVQVREPAVRDQLMVASSRLGRHLAEVRGAVRADLPPPVPQGPIATDERDFAAILCAMREEPFSDDKMAVLRDASRGRAFTTDQVIRVLEQFPFSDNKVDAAAMLYAQLTDPWNWYHVYGALTFSSDKDDLRRRTTG